MSTADMMHAAIPIDFGHVVPQHSRSASVSSSSSHSLSRPHSSSGLVRGVIPSPDDLFRASMQDHMRASSGQSASAYSFTSSELSTPGESPPNHNLGNPALGNPALKGVLRPSHIRARAQASPYHRAQDDGFMSAYSSSSETEDVGLYSYGSPDPYSVHPLYAVPTMPGAETGTPAGAFGRMSLGPDQNLEKLAANVRSATTTSAADRAKQIFVQAWLTTNYTPYADGNVPRQGLYFSYRRVCDQYGIPHINTATLGKAIRLCFPAIKTRRLGVRGNSKYHYCGIRPSTSAEAEYLQEYIRKSNNSAAQNSVNAARLANGELPSKDGSDEDEDDESEGANSQPSSKRNSLVLPKQEQPAFDMAEKTPTAASLFAQQAQAARPAPSYAPIRRRGATPQEGVLGASPALGVNTLPPTSGYAPSAPGSSPMSVRQLPHFPSIEDAVGAGGSSQHAVAARELWSWFAEHLDGLLESVRAFRFDQFEISVRTFWASLGPTHREVAHAPAVAGLMAKADAIVYDEVLEILRLQMLSLIPPPALQSLRQLAIKMEQVLLVALDQYGNTFVEPKVELGARFGHLVLRFLDIYQVTQALNTVLQNQKQVIEMRRSWARVNFDSVRNQSALVCNCRHEDLVQLLEVEFVQLLDNLPKTPEPVQAVMTWADKCCERLMGGGRAAAPGEDRSSMSSRSVLIRWGYVTSQVMRDLTIRSDPTFGAFQILKLFLDDWIAMNVLRQVALSTNSVAASVEPVMQQQYFTLSPMAGQEHFSGNLDVPPPRPMNGMIHTPTTSSMLAALQASDPFPVDSFPSDFGLPPFMDTTSNAPEDAAPGLSFPDFGGGASGPFDGSSGFGPTDMGMPAASHENNTTASPDA